MGTNVLPGPNVSYFVVKLKFVVRYTHLSSERLRNLATQFFHWQTALSFDRMDVTLPSRSSSTLSCALFGFPNCILLSSDEELYVTEVISWLAIRFTSGSTGSESRLDSEVSNEGVELSAGSKRASS